uniref:RING-type domain-containing protein n=1 Tax=Anabas testudineus TaxID=64144 RepID=A0A7N6ACS6_ANATE
MSVKILDTQFLRVYPPQSIFLALELSCPICLQFYSDPVTLPCGHNYCQACICKTVFTIECSGKTAPQCPECREEFQGVESLQKNFKLCSIVEGYRATANMLNWSETEPEKTFCDHCIDEQTLAVKICLKCEVSLSVENAKLRNLYKYKPVYLCLNQNVILRKNTFHIL